MSKTNEKGKFNMMTHILHGEPKSIKPDYNHNAAKSLFEPLHLQVNKQQTCLYTVVLRME